eukprot:3901805-Pyramimonas_sp.AAC.1
MDPKKSGSPSHRLLSEHRLGPALPPVPGRSSSAGMRGAREGGVESRGRAVRIKERIIMQWGYQHHDAGTFIGRPSLEREAG